MSELQSQIVEALRRYRVNHHWRASSSSGVRRPLYAVWAMDGSNKAAQLSEPTSHREAQADRERFIVDEIEALISAEVEKRASAAQDANGASES